jgi:RNA recognition motif-containing protein
MFFHCTDYHGTEPLRTGMRVRYMIGESKVLRYRGNMIATNVMPLASSTPVHNAPIAVAVPLPPPGAPGVPAQSSAGTGPDPVRILGIVVDGYYFASRSNFDAAAVRRLEDFMVRELERRSRLEVVVPRLAKAFFFPDPADAFEKGLFSGEGLQQASLFCLALKRAGWTVSHTEFKLDGGRWRASREDLALQDKVAELTAQGRFEPIGADPARVTLTDIMIVTGDADHLSTLESPTANGAALRWCTKIQGKANQQLEQWGRQTRRLLFFDPEVTSSSTAATADTQPPAATAAAATSAVGKPSLDADSNNLILLDRKTTGRASMPASVGKDSAAESHPMTISEQSSYLSSLWVGDLDLSVTEADLLQIFGQVGAVFSARICRLPSGQSTGAGYVNMARQEDAEAAIRQLNGMAIKGGRKPSRVLWNLHDPVARASTLYVWNFDSTVTESMLHEKFSPFGPVISCRVMMDPQRMRSRCFGFVSFNNPHSARNAIQALDKHMWGDRRLNVSVYQNTKGGLPDAHEDTEAQPHELHFSGAERFTTRHERQTFAELMKSMPDTQGFQYSPILTKPNSSLLTKLNSATKPNSLPLIEPVESKATNLCNLYVSNLNNTQTEESLLGAFSRFGRIVSHVILKDKATGRQLNSGLVAFSTPEEAAAAIEGIIRTGRFWKDEESAF